MSFSEQFEGWLREGFHDDVPSGVKAFAFNLLEPANADGVRFAVELVGSSQFDPNDSDWACEEIWEPAQRLLPIPSSYSGDSWEQCLEAIKSLVVASLLSQNHPAACLKSRLGVGVGFVDGDMHVVWQP